MRSTMSAIKVNFEIGHEASLRSKKTPEGFTHDWEVFVRGQENADISHFVDKVVFHLHETFPKPKRVVKEPPFSIKESGYAGFIFPIEIYLKNKDEPKKIKFTYDFTLQQSGFLKDRYIFPNPNEDFKKKLLKGGGLLTNNSYYTNPDQENQSRSRDSFSEEKQQLLSKPKLSSENVKKHKAKEHKDEIPHRTSSFENLFGPPIQKPPKISPDPKKLDKSAQPAKSEKKDKERSSSDKKSKHDHKEPKSDKIKNKEEKEKAKQEKIKNYSKEQEKSKDKASKRPSERPLSPDIIKKSRASPRRPPSPPPRSSSASSMKEDYKVQKHAEPEPRKPKPEEKPPEPKSDKEQKEKKKKEKKSHDRDKDRKERKEHKKENHKSKESPVSKEITKEVLKARDTPKEKEPIKAATPVKEKQFKPEKAIHKFSLENLQKTPPSADIEERSSHHKNKDKSDSERKHKHKKKDKKRDEPKDKHKESSKEKKHKHDKIREIPVEKPEIIELRETPIPKEPPPQELGSPISIDTASQCSSKSGLAKAMHVIDDINSSHSDSESSMIADDDDKPKLNNTSPEPIKEPSPEPEPEPEIEPELEPFVDVPPPQPKDKSKKHKEKSSKRDEKREEKRQRKRKAAEDEEVERKVAKTAVVVEPVPGPAFIEIEQGESSGSVTTETKVQDNGVSSSLGEDAEPGDLSPDYMVQLRDLQQRIMKIKNNEDLERVVNLIAETGRYEVTTQTFDFDLCLLDRSTVQQLIQLVGC